jgi:hypothetical protein
MTTEITGRNSEKQIARPLNEIPPLIKERLGKIEDQRKSLRKSFEEMTLEDRKEIGQLLIEAKSQIRHGLWGGWLKKNVNFTQGTANDYMRLAEISSRTNFETKAEAFRATGRPDYKKPRWRAPVSELVERTKRLELEALSKRQEREAERKLALRLIEIGYKILSVELHPDKKGGSHDAMRRLNAVRVRLKAAV